MSAEYVDEFVRSYFRGSLSESERRILQAMTDVTMYIGTDSGDGEDHSSISHVCQESCSYPHSVLYISGLVAQSDGREIRQSIEIDAEDLSFSFILECFEEYVDERLTVIE